MEYCRAQKGVTQATARRSLENITGTKRSHEQKTQYRDSADRKVRPSGGRSGSVAADGRQRGENRRVTAKGAVPFGDNKPTAEPTVATVA